MSISLLPSAISDDMESMFSVLTTSDEFSGIASKTSADCFVLLSQDTRLQAIAIATATNVAAYMLFFITDDQINSNSKGNTFFATASRFEKKSNKKMNSSLLILCCFLCVSFGFLFRPSQSL